MTADPKTLVLDFLARWSISRDAIHAAIRERFTATTIWENVGLATTTGPDEAIALMDQLRASHGVETIAIETLNISADGGVVLTERIDRMIDADGNEPFFGRCMGVFEIDGDRIRAWRDYFDTAIMPPPRS